MTGLWRIAISAILFLTVISKAASTNYVIKYVQPGIYIEHIGQAKIDRGTLRLELKFDKGKVVNDTININNSITDLNSLCERARELAHNYQCYPLIHHLREKQREIEWMNYGMKQLITNRRPKRGIVGNILTSLFGVNDEVYTSINDLDKNQKELINTSKQQTKFMLHALATFNETEVRISNQLKRFQEKIKEGIKSIDRMQAWFKIIDENKLNIQNMSAYQIILIYIEEVTEYHRKLLDVHYHRKQLFELISPIQVEETILNISSQLPSDIRIITYPMLQTKIQHSQNFIHIYGFLIVTEVTEYELIKATPIPLKFSKEEYFSFSIFNGLIANDYNSQSYFQLTEDELEKCFVADDNKYICTPTTTKNIETESKCVIDEIYRRTENSSCPIQKLTLRSTIWKQLHDSNTWMFITQNKLKVAIICDGNREDITLNRTGIIQISQNCLIKTSENTLTPKRRQSITVLGTMIQPAGPHVNLTSEQTLKKMKTESVLDTSDSIMDLVNEETNIEDQLQTTKWNKIHLHMIANSTITVILVTIVFLFTALICHKRTNNPKQPREREDPDMEGIPLERIHLYSSVPATEDHLLSSGQNV